MFYDVCFSKKEIQDFEGVSSNVSQQNSKKANQKRMKTRQDSVDVKRNSSNQKQKSTMQDSVDDDDNSSERKKRKIDPM